MRRYFGALFLAALGATLLLASCAPTSAPAAPTSPPAKAVEPTKAAAPAAPAPSSAPAAPTAAPAEKVDFPAGRPITNIVPFSAGGATDIVARILSPILEKELGAPVQVVNKAGGNTQVGMTELARAKPDGYTIGIVDIPAVNITYLIPERQAAYNQKSFLTLGMLHHFSPGWVVRADSPYKTVKDVFDAAKANPDGIKVGDSGLQNSWHLATLAAEKAGGVSFTEVHFDGGAPSLTALLGGHIDICTSSVLNAASQIKSGQVRMLGLMANGRDKFNPDIPTLKEQGYNIAFEVWYPVAVPAGTPKEVADILSAAVNKARSDPEFLKKADEAQATMAPPMTQAEIEKLWTDYDAITKPLLEMLK